MISLISHYQKNKMLFLPKPAFSRVVQEIFADIMRSGGIRIHASAVDALQEVAEDDRMLTIVRAFM